MMAKNNEKRDLIIEAGLQLIPYVGGTLSTLYFGTKQEKRFKRLESFYEEVAEDVERCKITLPGLKKNNEEHIISIIEHLNEKIEVESRNEKRDLFKNYFINLLLIDGDINYDQKLYFLNTLDSLNLLDVMVLNLIRENESVLVRDVTPGPYDIYEIVGSVGRLKNLGFLYARTGRVSIGSNEDNTMNEIVSISSFGQTFIDFCIK